MFKIPGINIVLLAILVLIALIIAIATSIHLKIKKDMEEYIINSGKEDIQRNIENKCLGRHLIGLPFLYVLVLLLVLFDFVYVF